mgnify:CR=1 FL=1
MAKRWYVVHAYSGYEKHVMRSLIERVKLAGMEDDFGEILVPTEEVVEMRNGQKRKSERKFFPGYVLVEMDMGVDATRHGDQSRRVDLLLALVEALAERHHAAGGNPDIALHDV